ncbi:MAG: TatD family hydrolase [Bacilli bacterium]|nr:TatD family hydrolase [Bacilli bacterium]
MFIDTHCHINDEKLYENRDEIIKRAKANGVGKMIVVGWDLKSSKIAVDIANEYDGVYAAVGFHPENLEEISDNALKEIELLCRNTKVVAIGEIGLDYHWFKESDHRAKQKEWFIKQINLANKLNLPVSIHARDASEDTFKILKDYPVAKGCVLHCYSGSLEMAMQFQKLNVFFGFDGPITFKNAENPRNCVRNLPSTKLLSETDCPYMTPVPFRGKDNKPEYIPLIVSKMAELKGLSLEEMERVIEENCFNLYGI